MKKSFRHFLNLHEIGKKDIDLILKYSHRLKKNYKTKQLKEKKILAIIFEKPSTRTKISFDVGMQL